MTSFLIGHWDLGLQGEPEDNQHALASLIVLCSSAAHTICRVDARASASNQGTSWIDADTSLQTALGNVACSETWAARGLYKPTTGTAVAASFTTRPGLQVHGGFVGGEISRDQAAPRTNPAVLFGNRWP